MPHRSTPYVHIYDVARVAEEQTNSSSSNRTAAAAATAPSRSCYIPVGTIHHSIHHPSSPLCVMHFVDRSHVILAHEGGQLSCWKIPFSLVDVVGTCCVRLVWRCSLSYSITSLTNLSSSSSSSSDCLVVGGHNGTFTLIHWKCCVRQAFSSEPSPRIVSHWNVVPSLRVTLQQEQEQQQQNHPYDLTKQNGMSIQHVISLDTSCCDQQQQQQQQQLQDETEDAIGKKSSTKPQQQPQQQRLAGCRLLWVTQGGWVLESSLRDVNNDSSSSSSIRPVIIHHRPPLAQYQKWDGTAVSLPTNQQQQQQHNSTNISYSTPQLPVHSSINQTKSLLAWTKVPTVTWTLPHHDRLVVTGTISALQCQPKADHGICLGWISKTPTNNTTAWRIQEIPCPGTNTPPSNFSIHPSGEWIVVPNGKSVVLWKAFGKK